ncbi:hypothetical protein G2W53_021561 [Senna tora]|uniref:Uncharacterized protein n=1 Tax=Senna tora TaxID=362788 RepID=A0A834WHZ8_9FABA|nr:hypothetical protein G2W53_021561 [Senna tora]
MLPLQQRKRYRRHNTTNHPNPTILLFQCHPARSRVIILLIPTRPLRRIPLLRPLRRRRRRRRRRLRHEEIPRQQHLIHLVHRQLLVGIHIPADRRVHHPRRHVHRAPGARDVQGEPIGVVPGLRPDGVAEGVETGEGDEGGYDVELDELVLLLVGEGVEEAGLEGGEGVVGGGEEGEAVVGVGELGVDLGGNLGRLEEADEGGEPAGFGFVPLVRPFAIPLLSLRCAFFASSRDSVLEDTTINALSLFTFPFALMGLLLFLCLFWFFSTTSFLFFFFFIFKSSFLGFLALIAVFELLPLLILFSAFDFWEEAMASHWEIGIPKTIPLFREGFAI